MSEVREIPTTVAEPTAERRSTEVLLAVLKPRQVEAEEGSLHTIYTFETKDSKPVEVLFYSPNELPFIESEVRGKFVVINNGKEPRWRTNEEWERFISRTLEASDNSESRQRNYTQQVEESIASGRAMVLVEAKPEALLETAKQLGMELEEPLRETLSELRNKKLTEASLAVIDSVLAGNLVNDAGEFRQEHQHEGEALYLLALMGNKEARQLLDKKREIIHQMDKIREERRKAWFAKQRQKYEELGKKGLELKSLVTVHATRYLPAKGPEGLEIATTFEGSGWTIPRDTIHFTLNHEVTPHMYGSWEDNPYVVISPLEEMIKANGKPTVLNTVDTFWEIGPGRKLKLPKKAAIVRPSDLPTGEIIRGLETTNVHYKSSGLKPKDIATLSEELGRMRVAVLNLSGRLEEEGKVRKKKLNTDLQDIIVGTVWSFNDRLIGDDVIALHSLREQRDRLKEVIEPLDILADLQEQTAEDIVGNILNIAKMENELEVIELKGMITERIRRGIIAAIKHLAVEKKIQQMGYELQPGGMWAWGGSWTVTAQTKVLGAKLEVPVAAHSNHISGWVEEAAIGKLSALLEVNINAFEREREREREIYGIALSALIQKGKTEVKERVKRFEDSREYIREEFMPEVTQDTRRMLYLTGVI